MDFELLYIIIAIVVAIFIVELYKRENNRITTNLHADNLKQLLTLTALEYQENRLEVVNESERPLIEKKVALLVDNYEKRKIQSSVFQKKMDDLIKNDQITMNR